MIDRKTRIERIGARLKRLCDMERQGQEDWHLAVSQAATEGSLGNLGKRPWCSSIRYVLKYETYVDFMLKEAGFVRGLRAGFQQRPPNEFGGGG
jgi:hypothetical protein